MDEQTWHRRTEVPLMIAGFAYLVAFSWRVIADLQGPQRVAADLIILITWAMFIGDYLVRLLLAKQRWIWFRTHLLALVFALIPVLRLVRLLRVLTKLPGMKPTRGALLRTQIIVYGAGASVLLVFVASLAVLEAERHAPDADITTFGIALWWSCVTVTTTGFGDYTPVTVAGRVIGVGLMLGGVALAGVITATLASWVVERGTRNNDAEEPATRAQVRELMARIDELSSRLPGDGAGGAGGQTGTAPPGPSSPSDQR
ncbi:two pore domain potassium channel family protein [Microbacterium jejuense]|uniref:Two pore domain potassium channel family protein n=1 Tax=Microbacterium jejuense TaxID=1263637 RepID=A0ABS7HPJ6_9MICO|nr:potassium channel family protein [Microbacterium jejuense]MBW9094881.1 two pore domain potassium channel family protein [Microbacterium jejuense]